MRMHYWEVEGNYSADEFILCPGLASPRPSNRKNHHLIRQEGEAAQQVGPVLWGLSLRESALSRIIDRPAKPLKAAGRQGGRNAERTGDPAAAFQRGA